MSERPSSKSRHALLWVLACLLMLGSAVYQRLTGPTHPYRQTVSVRGEAHRLRLPRSSATDAPALVELPIALTAAGPELWFRRYPTDEPFEQVELRRIDDEGAAAEARLGGELPVQPAAGKVEYHLLLDGGDIRVPAQAPEQIVLRYKDPVPAGFLIPHIALMFLAVLIGLRAGLSTLAQPERMRGHAWTALLLMTLGGLVFGPIVQKYAFGAYWTGFPFGYDLTDNKLLVMWVVWLLACLWIGRRQRTDGRPLARVVLLLATIVMVGVYLIPHSMRGSELDYAKLEQVEDAKDAIGTSDD